MKSLQSGLRTAFGTSILYNHFSWCNNVIQNLFPRIFENFPVSITNASISILNCIYSKDSYVEGVWLNPNFNNP